LYNNSLPPSEDDKPEDGQYVRPKHVVCIHCYALGNIYIFLYTPPSCVLTKLYLTYYCTHNGDASTKDELQHYNMSSTLQYEYHITII
jgi:hypothetical protein